jgi:hypothetical protein
MLSPSNAAAINSRFRTGKRIVASQFDWIVEVPSYATVPASARAFDEKVESLIMDSHDGANRIQDPHWCKGGQS